MAELFCKLCGGAIKVNPGETVTECSYCGYKQAIPEEMQVQTQAQPEGKNAVEEDTNNNEIAELKDGYAALKNGDFAKAISIFNDAIMADESLVSARIGLLLANLNCTCEEKLGELENSFEDNEYFFELLKYADAETAERIGNYNLKIFENQRKRIEEQAFQRKLQVEQKTSKPSCSVWLDSYTRKYSEAISQKNASVRKFILTLLGKILLFLGGIATIAITIILCKKNDWSFFDVWPLSFMVYGVIMMLAGIGISLHLPKKVQMPYNPNSLKIVETNDGYYQVVSGTRIVYPEIPKK